jgi:hypothetical protein
MTEQQPYEVEREYPEFEVRRYPDYVLVDVDAPGAFFEAGNRGFRPLLRYISGSNAASQQIAMTAPVIQQPRSATEHRVSFVMPAGMDAASAPTPRDASLSTRAVPAHRVAARRFGGGSNEERYAENAAALSAAVAAAGLKFSGDVYFARYDPPWKPGFLKRNEALVALAD